MYVLSHSCDMQFPTFKTAIVRLCILCVVANFAILGAGASSMINESFVVTDAFKIEVIGANTGGQLGASLSSGDLNGDGMEDLVVGAPFASTGLKDWNGAVHIVFGRENSANKPIDLESEGYIVNFFGESSGDQLGTSISVGDYNNDGIDDVAIGAYNAYEDSSRPGKVYVKYGQVDWSRRSYNFGYTEPDLTLSGQGDGDEYGLSLSTVDVNGDMIDDLFVGAPEYSLMEGFNGAVYGYFGGEAGLSTDFDIEFHGESRDKRFGSSIAAGNITGGDNINLVIGSYKSTSEGLSEAGRLYLFEGPYVAGANQTYFATIEGVQEKQWFGFDLDLGDLNDDGYDDLAVTSFPYGLEEDVGHVSVFYGGERFAEKGEELLKFYDNKFYRSVVIGGAKNEALLGASVQIDDYNGDGVLDIAAGAPGIAGQDEINSGEVYVVYNGADGFANEYSVIDNHVGSLIHGENAADWFGYTIHSMDFNGDSLNDLAVGSRYSDDNDSGNDGKVFIMLGRSEPFGEEKVVLGPEDDPVHRGELINRVLNDFDIKESKAAFLENCEVYREFCLFTFMAASSYDDIQLEGEMLLYPDVLPDSKYYESINAGTMLGLVNGYMHEANSPFYPEDPVTRIQALKVILSAVELVPPKYKYQLVAMLGSDENLLSQTTYFADVDPVISHMWWYPRYVNFAVDNAIIDVMDNFRPDDYVTAEELEGMIENTLEFLNPEIALNEEIKS
jgi:FG-GAP repeat protein/S-layer family protein